MTVVRVPADPAAGRTDHADGEADPGDGATPPAGLPRGVIELAARRWREAEQAATSAGLAPPRYDDAGLRERLVAELTAPLRLGDWPDPNQPRAVAGGWVNDEVIDEDRPAFEALVEARPEAGPEALASAAQELRWPVTPYRRILRDPVGKGRPAANGRWRAPDTRSTTPATPTGRIGERSRHPVVVDLSTHWAGPLTTALLAEAGAEVVKVDPDCRPDGFRERPGLYRHLNGAKTVIDLDLRHEPDRHRLESLLSTADLLVESFSRRVLPNLGYDRDRLAEINPALAVISIKAFPASSPEAEWLAYGPGVHAASGLGWLPGQARPQPAPIAYPDLIAGITAYARAMTMLDATAPARTARSAADAGHPASPDPDSGERTSGGDGGGEVTLAGSILPLVALAVDASEPADG